MKETLARIDNVAAALREDRLAGVVEEGDADVTPARRGRDRPLAAGVAVRMPARSRGC